MRGKRPLPTRTTTKEAEAEPVASITDAALRDESLPPRENLNVLDPEGRYPCHGWSREERYAHRLLRLLTTIEIQRTRDVIQIDSGGEVGIVLLVTPEALEVRLPTVEWYGPQSPRRTSRLLNRTNWECLTDVSLAMLVGNAQRARRDEFSKCRFCSEDFPPEWAHARDVCFSCAERHLGVIH